MKTYVPWFLCAFLAVALGIRSWQMVEIAEENVQLRKSNAQLKQAHTDAMRAYKDLDDWFTEVKSNR